MPSLLSSAFSLRRDPRILKIPPYLSLLCIIAGFAWLFLLPLNEYSRRTYISENALLPGQVHTYFGGSDQNVFRAFKAEITALSNGQYNNTAVNDGLEVMLRQTGLKTGRQAFHYENHLLAGIRGDVFYEGENLYAILQAPRGDATEAIVLVAPWTTIRGESNRNGVALALTLARYFRRWSLWSKDIILVFPPDSVAGPQAWVDAYHDAHDLGSVASLPLKSGALQGALALDYAHEGRFESVHIIYDGVNGMLPNLDLINAVSHIAGGQMGMGTALQRMFRHRNTYADRLYVLLRGMVNQALGIATGAHSCFIPYHVDAITLQPFSTGAHHSGGNHDEMALGRLVEGSFRSLNNLLEHLHQSFFFYLLMHRDRFVSIGTYLPSAMVLAANFTIMAIFLWVKSGQPEEGDTKNEKSESQVTTERQLFLPLGLVAALHAISAVPLFIFNHAPSSSIASLFVVFDGFTTALPFAIAYFLPLSAQQYRLVQCFSLLLLGMFLSALATLNFSLAFAIAVFTSPLSFVRASSFGSVSPLRRGLRWAAATALVTLSPPTVIYAASMLAEIPISDVLREASFGWTVWGMYTSIVVWCVWWPAWVSGMTVVLGWPREMTGKMKTT